jgi:hypothetical protein
VEQRSRREFGQGFWWKSGFNGDLRAPKLEGLVGGGEWQADRLGIEKEPLHICILSVQLTD